MMAQYEVEVVTVAFILAIFGLIATLTNSVDAGLTAAFGFAVIFVAIVALARASYKYMLCVGVMFAITMKSSGASDWEDAILLAVIATVILGAIVWFGKCVGAINSGVKVR